MDFDTFTIAAWSLGSKVFTAAVALVFVHGMTKMYDRTDKVKTKETFDLIEGDANAAAIYKGLQIVGFCLLAGAVFS